MPSDVPLLSIAQLAVRDGNGKRERDRVLLAETVIKSHEMVKANRNTTPIRIIIHIGRFQLNRHTAY